MRTREIVNEINSLLNRAPIFMRNMRKRTESHM